LVETLNEITTSASVVIGTVCESEDGTLLGHYQQAPDVDVTKIDMTSTSCDAMMVNDRPGRKRRWTEAELGAFNRVFKQHM